MIICFSEESIKDIYSTILDNFITLANNSNGLCIIKKMITYAKKEETIKLIQKKIIDNIQNLITNSYGNYTIQTVFEIWNNEYSEPIVSQLFNNFHTLSLHKYSSNVVEKCLEKGGDLVLTKFIEEICHKSKLLG
jgi:pumilio RNA-binding family